MVVAPNGRFERDDNDLYTDIMVKFTLAALGGQIEVETLTGKKAVLKIAPGTQPARSCASKGRECRACAEAERETCMSA